MLIHCKKTIVTLSFLGLLTALLCARTWTNLEGQSFSGTLYKQDSTHVWVRSDADARIYKIEKTTLIEDDQLFLAGEVENTAPSDDAYWETDLDKVVKRLDDDETETCLVVYRYKTPDDIWQRFMKEAIMQASTQEKIGNRIKFVIEDERNEDLDRRNESMFLEMGDGPILVLIGNDFQFWRTRSIGGGEMTNPFDGEKTTVPSRWENHELFLATLEEYITASEDLRD